MADSLSVKVSYTLLPNPAPQVFYARIRQPIPVTRTQEDSGFAYVSLKPCLSAICKSRPDLVLDLSNLDYSIASLDYQETQYVRDNKLADQAKGLFVSPIKANGHDKVWEGKGLLSWALQAAQDAEAEMIVGKVDSRSSSLEVCLQLTERKTQSRPTFLDSLYSSAASSAFPAASPSSAAGLSPSCFDDPATGMAALQAENQPDFMLNVIQPTPARPELTAGQCIPSTSSSPAAIAANHPKRALSAPLNSPLLPIAEASPDPSSAPPTAQQQQQILGLVQQLLPQFQANSADNQAVLPLIQTLVQYLAAPPPSSGNSNDNTPISGVNMDSLVSLLQTARQSSDVLPPASVPAPQPNASRSNTLKASTKRKRDTSAPPAAASSSRPPVTSSALPASAMPSSTLDEVTTSAPKIKRSKARLQVDAAEGGEEAAKLKYDPVGCSNCKTNFATLWRKSKNDPTDRLCNACGVYFNRQGKHRPAEFGSGTKKTQPHPDALKRGSSASITPTLPAIDTFSSTSMAFPPVPVSAAMKASMTSPPRRPDFLEDIRKSPRRHSIAASSPVRHHAANFITTESPGTALNRIMSDAMGPEAVEPKKKRIKAKPTSSKSKKEPTSDLPFMEDDFFNKAFAHPPAPATSASLASSVFSEWQPQSDIFSTMTSEVDPLPARKKRHRTSSSGALDAPFDFGSLFSDQSWAETPSDARPSHHQFFNEAVKGKTIFSDIPPSSPPFKHLLPHSGSDSGESPNNPSGGSPLNPGDELSKELADLSNPNKVTWSEEAVSFLQNALMQDPSVPDLSGLGMDLGDPATLQDLLSSLTTGLSPGSVDTPPTAGLDVGLVAQVDAETAMEIWEREVQARFGDVPT